MDQYGHRAYMYAFYQPVDHDLRLSLRELLWDLFRRRRPLVNLELEDPLRHEPLLLRFRARAAWDLE